MDKLDYEVTQPGLITLNVTKPVTPEPKSARPKFGFKRAGEMTEKPVPEHWLIKGLIPKESLGVVFGPPANAKSLFVLDTSFCTAAGIDYEGRTTEQGDVVIIAGEGFYGYSKRLKALEEKYGKRAPMNLAISEQAAQLNDPASCDDIAQAIREAGLDPKLIIIDTLNRNFCADENSSRDIAQLMTNLEQFFKPFGATIIIVHHSGHGTEQRSRGSSAIRGALDFEYSVIKDNNNVAISNHKAKDFEPPKPLNFILKPVFLNCLPEEGEQQTSVYLEYAGEAEKTSKKGKLSARNTNILQSLTDALRQKGIDPTEEIRQKFGGFSTGTFKNVVPINDWREYAYKAISANTDSANKKAFERFRNNYLNIYLMEHDGYVWRIDQSDGDKLATTSDKLLNPSNDGALSSSDSKRQIATIPKLSHDDDATTATHSYRSVAVVASQSTPTILDDVEVF
jgi:AAA domain